MHWTLDSASVVSETANEGTTSMWAAVFDREYGATDIEKGNVYAVQLNELSATGRQFVGKAGFAPLGGHKLMER